MLSETPNPGSRGPRDPAPALAARPASETNKITVLLADDHTVVREGLRLLLESANDIKVVGEVENGRLAVAMAKKLHPDVVVLDVVMPQLNGVEAARQITKEVPSSKVLILSSYSDDDRVQQSRKARRAIS